MILALFWGGSDRLWARIKRRVAWTLMALGAGGSLAVLYREEVFAFLLVPANGQLSPFPGGLPVYNAPLGGLRATFDLAIKAGIVTAFPVLTTGMLVLFKPFMPRHFFRFLLVFIPVTVVCFLAGAAFAYYVMLPAGFRFIFSFTEGVAVPLILLSEYVSTIASLILALGIVFELPPAMYLSTRMGILSYRHFRRFRRYFPWAALFLAAIISPGFDSVNMLMVFTPMVALYEVGLFASWVGHPEEGNYLWLKTIARGLRRVWRGLVWVVRRPVVLIRWSYWKIWDLGSGILWD